MVDRTYPFDELREAYAYVDTGRKVGNVVVTMPGSSPGRPHDRETGAS